MRHIRRSKSLALIFLLAAVVVGGGLGFTAERFVTHDRATSRRANLYDELELTPPQRARLDSILDEQRRRVDEVMRPVRPLLDSIKADANAQIRRSLDPDQLATFDALQAKMRQQNAARKEKEKGKEKNR